MRRFHGLAAIGPHVAAGHEANIGLFHEAADDVGAAAADADRAHHDLFAGRHGAVLAQHRGGDQVRHGQGSSGVQGRFQEVSSF